MFLQRSVGPTLPAPDELGAVDRGEMGRKEVTANLVISVSVTELPDVARRPEKR